jgi:hypothetical protein
VSFMAIAHVSKGTMLQLLRGHFVSRATGQLRDQTQFGHPKSPEDAVLSPSGWHGLCVTLAENKVSRPK